MEVKNEGSEGSCASTGYAVPPHLQLQMERVLRLARRLKKADELLQRAYDAMRKEHWAEGESESQVSEAIMHFLANEAVDRVTTDDTKGDPIGWKIVAVGEDGSVLCEKPSGKRARFWFHPTSA